MYKTQISVTVYSSTPLNSPGSPGSPEAGLPEVARDIQSGKILAQVRFGAEQQISREQIMKELFEREAPVLTDAIANVG